MGTLIKVDFAHSNTSSDNGICDLTRKVITRSVSPDVIRVPTEKVELNSFQDHTSEPIKNIDDINRISKFLISEGRYRDNMLFIVGINFGLRVSDLLQLKFCHLINDNLTYKNTFPILEKKTSNTRKSKKNRYITINDAVIEAVSMYLNNTNTQCSLNDFMFRSESNNHNSDKPMDRKSVDRILKGIASSLNLNIKMSTHTLRKTFAYHQMVMSNNDPRKLLLLQKIFGHSTAAQTLDYIGITNEEIEDAYLRLNLGNNKSYIVNSSICETYGTM